ncbi:MAG TPA: hypothetical protein DCZ34_02090 [Clostridiales bacterium]|nr:hypothetical protein [Clostridiales bacterium]
MSEHSTVNCFYEVFKKNVTIKQLFPKLKKATKIIKKMYIMLFLFSKFYYCAIMLFERRYYEKILERV